MASIVGRQCCPAGAGSQRCRRYEAAARRRRACRTSASELCIATFQTQRSSSNLQAHLNAICLRSSSCAAILASVGSRERLLILLNVGHPVFRRAVGGRAGEETENSQVQCMCTSFDNSHRSCRLGCDIRGKIGSLVRMLGIRGGYRHSRSCLRWRVAEQSVNRVGS